MAGEHVADEGEKLNLRLHYYFGVRDWTQGFAHAKYATDHTKLYPQPQLINFD